MKLKTERKTKFANVIAFINVIHNGFWKIALLLRMFKNHYVKSMVKNYGNQDFLNV